MDADDVLDALARRAAADLPVSWDRSRKDLERRCRALLEEMLVDAVAKRVLDEIAPESEDGF